jgi:hypothetical protein
MPIEEQHRATLAVSAATHRRLARSRAWLEARDPGEEVVIVAASLDAADELARGVAAQKGAIFGWHRVSLAQLASVIAAPLLAGRGLVRLSRLGTMAVVARLVHRLKSEGGLVDTRQSQALPGWRVLLPAS